MTTRVILSAAIFAALSLVTPTYGQTSETAAQATEAASDKSPVSAKDAVTDEELTAALTDLDAYDYGKEREFLLTIDAAIRQTAGKEERRKKLANALTDRAANNELAYGARDLALRRLVEIGKGPQVGRLEKLLADEDERVAEMARQTIAGIPGDRANKALMKALGDASGKLREGIINSLGERRVKDAVKQLKEIARQDNSSEARAAMLALGKIGNGDAGRALLDDIRPPDAVREAWFMAMNDAATALAGENKKLASRLYERVLQLGGKSPARLAAFKGQALLAENPEAVALKALDRKDPAVAQVARELLVRGDDPSITTQLGARLNTVAPDKKVVTVEILGARGDKTALDAVTQLAEHPTADNQDLQVAALRALEYLGNQGSVPMLIKTAADEKGRVAEAAKQTIVGMSVPEVDAELLRLINQAATPAEKVVAIEAASKRKSEGGIAQLNQAAGSDNQKVAIAAFKAIGELGGYKDLAPILQTQTQLSDEKILREGARAITALAKTSEDITDAVKQVETAYKSSDKAGVKASLLGVFGKLNDEKALKIIQENLSSPDEKLQDAAVRALADFPDASSMDSLLKVATDGKSDVHRVLALRRVAKLLVEPSAKTNAEQLDTAKRVLELATGPEEKKAVIGALADVKLPGVLPLILPFLDQPEYKDESAAAIIKQAPTANAIDPKTTAELLNPLKEKLTPEQWNKLESALTPSDSGEKAIRAYQASTTYKLDDTTSVGALLQQEFDPETGGGDWPQSVWAGKDEKGNKVGKADLATYFTDTKNVVVYLRVHVWSSEAKTVRMDTGSDDGMRAWVNGTRVFAADNTRGFTWWGDETEINLNRGWNTVLLKSGQGGGNWALAARIVDKSGEPVPGLKYSALPQE